MYTRIIQSAIEKDLFKGKAIIIAGARQVGKTTLVDAILNKRQAMGEAIVRFNGDDPKERSLITNKSKEQLILLVDNARIIFIDEAQKIETIGQTVKLIVDHFKKDKQVILTGSSSINLFDSTLEPLTGRKFTYHLFPLSLEELYPAKNVLTIQKELEHLLLFGSYPDVVAQTTFDDKVRLLRELTNSYLYKDILEFQLIRNPDILHNLLKAVALQIGKEVSYSELSRTVGIEYKTVERYIDLLEKSFIIFRLSSYSTNKRREIARSKKIYFYDVGVRNAVIDLFAPFDRRNDVGSLWENFVIAERLKLRTYHSSLYAHHYFWRTYDGSEVDLVEEREGKLFGYEMKWKEKRVKKPEKFLDYPQAHFEVVTTNDIPQFLFPS